MILLWVLILYAMCRIISIFYKKFYSISNNQRVWSSLKEKYALITFTSTEFTTHLCHWLASKKINLVVIGPNEDKLLSLKSKLIKKIDIFTHSVNISHCSDFSFLDKYDIGLVINCVGDIESIPEYFIDQNIDNVIDSQLRAPLNLIQSVMTTMAENHKGYIVNIGFGHCSKPVPQMSLNYAIKSAFKSWSESMYYEMMQYNVNVEYVEIGDISNPSDFSNFIFPSLKKVTKDITYSLGSSYFTIPCFIHFIIFEIRQFFPKAVIGRVRNNLNQEIKKINLSQNQ